MKDKNIVILTGAGISAESGLSTFRDNGGLWCNHRIEDVATPQAFFRNPMLVHDFYNSRRSQLKDVEPNAAHQALAKLAAKWQGKVYIITQNVDDLHERAAKNTNKPPILLHMHGELKKARCAESEKVFEWDGDLSTETPCPCCDKKGNMRPHIVWFGEIPLYMEAIQLLLKECSLFMSIGTSGNVYPAAGFVHEVRSFTDAHTVELNKEPSQGKSLFHEKIYGNATEIVPAYIDKILTGQVKLTA